MTSDPPRWPFGASQAQPSFAHQAWVVGLWMVGLACILGAPTRPKVPHALSGLGYVSRLGPQGPPTLLDSQASQ